MAGTEKVGAEEMAEVGREEGREGVAKGGEGKGGEMVREVGGTVARVGEVTGLVEGGLGLEGLG